VKRRQLLRGAGAGGLALLAGCGLERPNAATQTTTSGTLETTTIRVARLPSICLAPWYLAEDLLRADGFTDIKYVSMTASDVPKRISAGDVDLASGFAAVTVNAIDKGNQMRLLAGVHLGCFELFGTERIKVVRDLMGRTIAVTSELTADTPHYAYLAGVLAQFGMDIRTDVKVVQRTFSEVQQQLQAGEIDAFLGFPTQPQELRAKGIGHVVLDSMVNKPWSQYYCCLITGNREFVAKNPVATKRVMSAVLRAADLVAKDPTRVARFLIDKGYADNYDYALHTMHALAFGVWRDIEPEDTVRFYALRLGEAGAIKSTPQKIIADASDWRFLSELKKEI
jgi:NitT/TauT family transport system substrate-binding protein